MLRIEDTDSVQLKIRTSFFSVLRDLRHNVLREAICTIYYDSSALDHAAIEPEACSSRSTPKPRPPSPTARPNITFHTYACPPAYAKWYCLNEATCFTVKIGESLLYNCE
uniref:Uncharacterized protein n=1 Tax=Timema bartmani TaxID=61472 RepID=A0A7R9ESH9_9NEOP|nr:unnamed protein product [Timema bartmani]